MKTETKPAEKTLFQPGGKPGPGRPKGAKSHDICRDIMIRRAEMVLAQGIDNGDPLAAGFTLLLNKVKG